MLGLEVSGRIVQVGENVAAELVGQNVCALVDGGGYAQYCLAEAELLLPVAEPLTLRDAAALPEAVFTSWFNLVTLGALGAGKWLLIHGGASGVGTVGIQIGRMLGARVAITAGSEEKCALCRHLGAELAVNYRTGDFVEAMNLASGGHGADVILDMVGGLYAQQNVDALALDGRIVHLTNAQTPHFTATLDSILRKRAVITGSLMRPLEQTRKRAIAQEILARLWPEAGRSIRPVVAACFPLEAAEQAHLMMESGQHAGKVLLSMHSEGSAAAK